MKKILMFPFTILAYIFGKLSWHKPGWLNGIGSLIKTRPRTSYSAIALMIIIGAGYLYYDSLPRPISVIAELSDIQITPTYEGAKPDDLYIEFAYDYQALNNNQRMPDGEPSVARIDLVGQTITQGIQLSPAKKGVWTWINDRRIQFTPETDWPAGTKYKLGFDKTLFSSDTRLSHSNYDFITPALSAEFSHIEFYQDPQNISLRRVVATLSFSHPIKKDSFEERLSMQMRASGEGISSEGKAYSFSVTYSKNQREAYIQSESISLPLTPSYMKIALNKGYKTLIGGEAGPDAIETKTLIPDVYSFLKVSTAQLQIVRNEKNEPEQVLNLEFTDDIDQKELLNKLAIYLLPKKGMRNGKNHWRGPRQVTANVLADSKPVEFELMPNEKTYSKSYSLKFELPENDYVYLKIDKGLSSLNKFIQSSFFDSVLNIPRYPKEINIAGEGSVLTFTGDHQLSVLSRGVDTLKYKVGRLLENQLYHLISQTSGDISSPTFNNWNFSEQNISETINKIVDLDSSNPKSENYSSFDLSEYLPNSNNRFGLFFVEVSAWDKIKRRSLYGIEDRRLILVTDLGIIVKNNADKSHDIFVQSLASGKPVAGATIELLGRNGIPIASTNTDSKGHAKLASTKGLKNENSPTVYVVKTAKDISFIPFDRRSRQINLSRFDIGGVRVNPYTSDTLNAFLFSDRGIYRPGEEVNIGIIVKNLDLSNVENIPLEIVVRDPRNKEVKLKKIRLAEKGFVDFQYLTDASANTGEYNVSLHLIRNEKFRGRSLGRTTFKVEEFQADTMKISSQLQDVVDKGWNTQETIKASISLKNLFGTPAQDRKISARIVIEPKVFNFSAFKGYIFTDHYLNKNDKPLRLNTFLGEKQSDADGLAEFDIDLKDFRSGSYSLRFTAEGFDQAGGRSVSASNTALISPLTQIVGYKADGKLDYIKADSERTIEFIAIDPELNSLASNDLQLKLLKIQHVSTLVKQRNGTYKYQTIEKEETLTTKALSISKTGFAHVIDTTTPGDYALEIFDKEDRRLSKVAYSVVGFANLAGKIDKNAELAITLNKKDYLPGEMIGISIKAPYKGSGLITIETDRVHQFKWFTSSEESTVQEIQLPNDIEGSAYINVAFVRSINSKEIFSSPLSYAVEPFYIDKSKREIEVSLSTKKIVRPGKAMKIDFKTSKPTKIAIFAVSEGILQVAGYKTPDPLAHYLKKRALGVETLQILDLVLPEFELLKALSASGGGMSEMMSRALSKNLNPFKRKADMPAVFWSGIQDANSEMSSIEFNVPDTFAGELRIMAVAVGEDAIGATSSTAIARGPFVISPNVLSHAAPGDEFLVTVGIANIIDGAGEDAAVKLEVSSSEHLEILDKKSTTLSISEGSEGKYTFKVKAKAILGAAELKFTVSHKNEQATRTASLSVRPATHYYTSLSSGFDSNSPIDLTLPRTLNPRLAKQSVAASASPLVIVDGLVSYLDSYPHGCTEQVVSKVFPLVGLLSHPAYAAHLPKVHEQFSHLIDKLRERQLPDGGFSFWPGGNYAADYPSIYVMHFLLEASQLGYAVPPDMLERGKDFLRSYAGKSSDSLNAARNRANAIYLLTRMGVVSTNYLVDLEESLEINYKKVWRQDLLASYMAATYSLLQKTDEAESLIAGYTLNAKAPEDSDDFHSALALDAQHIYLLAAHFEKRAKDLDGDSILKLSERIFRGEYNTISSAYAILALGAFSKLVLDFDYKEAISFSSIDENDQQEKLAAALAPFMQARFTDNFAAIRIESDTPLYYMSSQSGFNAKPATEVVREGLEIYRDFLDDDGNVINSFEQGKEVTVRLKIRALDDQQLKNIAIVDLLPGGFEVLRSSVARTAYGWRANYVDVREDRVIYYGDFGSSVTELRYRVKLTTAGSFVVPPSYGESMYDRAIRANSKAASFSVTPSSGIAVR